MTERVPEADAVFRDIVASYGGSPAITAKRMFGSTALLIDGRIAAFVTATGRLVLKLPPEARERLAATGVGSPMEMGGRVMRAWLAVPLDPDVDWFALTAEAVEHVRGLAPEPPAGSVAP